MRAALLITALLLACPAAARAAEGEVAPPEGVGAVDAEAVIRRAAVVLGGERTYLEGRLSVEPRRRAPRGVVFRLWDDRAKNQTLLRVVAPRGIAGTGLLRLPPNVWGHDPRKESTARVPPAVLLEPWLGSDFSRADLLRASLPPEDYLHRLLRIETKGEGEDAERCYVIESLPARDGPDLWGRAVSWIAVEDGTPLRREFYARDGAKRRAVRFEDVREAGGRRVPHRWVATTPGEEGEESRVDLVAIDFDASFDPEIFTTRQLSRP